MCRAAQDAEAFRRLLRRRRLAGGLSQEQLAERAPLGVRSIQDLERGIGQPLRRTTAALVQPLDLEGAREVRARG